MKFLPVRLLTAVIGLLWTGAHGAEFVAGADFSHLGFFEDRGIVYKDGGNPEGALAILKRGGLNCVRLRLFTSSAEQARADGVSLASLLAKVADQRRREMTLRSEREASRIDAENANAQREIDEWESTLGDGLD